MKKPPVKSIRHKGQKRVHIPSGEEAGYEAASPLVQAKDEAKFPKNPIVHRGQDPELYWLNKYGKENDDSPLVVDLRSLYRHEHIAPEGLIKGLYRIVATEDRQQPDHDERGKRTHRNEVDLAYEARPPAQGERRH